ncbi:MAG: cytidine deaminase [Nitrospinota bacterium]|nr:cytidine deaminase [Nitrospinota bacterium]
MQKPQVTDEELARMAIGAMEKAYAPYSNFHVGAAVATEDGAIFTGANVENASYGLTICAERVAIFTAVSQGHIRITRVAVAASNLEEVFPCGACRQVLNEFGPEMNVITIARGQMAASYSLSELLPRSFGPADLQK